MRTLVTGGSGFFGTLLCEQLASTGHAVTNLDISRPEDAVPGVTFLEADIRDVRLVQQACADTDVVFHNVAQVPLAKDPELFESVNSFGTANLLRACERAGVRKVVYTSSSAVFGIPEANPVTETTPPRPVEAYGKAKLDGELLCQAAITRGLDVSIVRPRTILGHGRLGIFGLLFDWVADGVDVFVFDGGHNRYQFVHAADLANACILAGERPGPEIYNIGTPDFGTMGELMQALCDHAGTGAGVRSIPSKAAAPVMKGLSRVGLAPFADYHWLMYARELWFDTTKAETELGWKAQYSNSEMICESYDWFLTNRASLSTHGVSHHTSTVKQGVLSVGKKLIGALPVKA
ncbi:MAG: NAD-dependent epimerase/dehydratase family protein [Candidatus Nanopelagicales bacterium]|nr:NAD-dependent epimerase/dehydratase family protein [Actinomycetota bacterium]HNL50337.1 NAD-dependent epimerase/dehydratase family protein [Actinomycetota bacterium]HNO14602.1 NAD-dependent epimerase/dehydratase family protein [Actinomycetota bacterium]HUM85763.1 NAD-dependent epimerase/dehydratase family protein [Actinomycetota bacterium]